MSDLVQNSRLFLRACGLRVGGLKLDYADAYMVGFQARGTDVDGASQLSAVIQTLERNPVVTKKANGDCRIYEWEFEPGQLLTIRTWYDQGSVDYGFYVVLTDHNIRKAKEAEALESLS